MTRLESKLAALKADNKKAVFIYITPGAPDVRTSVKAILEAEKNGANVIEIGIPFSDPLADGPVIQTSSSMAIKNKMTVRGVIDVVKEIRRSSDIPLIGMGYVNNLISYGYNGRQDYIGFERFVKDAKYAGMDGLIIPDVPHEESRKMREICKYYNFHLVEFITPMTTQERMKDTCAAANGFIYCVSNTGVTGVKELDYTQIGEVAQMAREFTKTPLAVGFGIGNAEAAVKAAEFVDGIIVGSAVVKRLMDGQFDEAMELIQSMRDALDKTYCK